MSAPLDDEVADNILLTEHFTYRPILLLDEIINSINHFSFKAIDAIEKGLLTAQPADLGFRIPSKATPAAAEAILQSLKYEIENGVHQIETLFTARIDKNFDILEIHALRNHLSVPRDLRDWVRLGNYEGLSLVEYKDAPTEDAVALQRRKYREALKLHALLETERARNEATLRSLRMLILNKEEVKERDNVERERTGSKQEEDVDMNAITPEQKKYPVFAFLQNKGDLSGSSPLTSATNFALSQAPPLKSILDNLEPRLQELRDGNDNGVAASEEEKTWRRTRLEFVEKETKRHLENVRGLELGEQGVVRDGEWQGEGRTLGMGEVESLEKVVEIVGGSIEGQPMDES